MKYLTREYMCTCPDFEYRGGSHVDALTSDKCCKHMIEMRNSLRHFNEKAHEAQMEAIKNMDEIKKIEKYAPSEVHMLLSAIYIDASFDAETPTKVFHRAVAAAKSLGFDNLKEVHEHVMKEEQDD